MVSVLHSIAQPLSIYANNKRPTSHILIIDVASPLLKELVNHASNTLIRCAHSLSGRTDEDLALLTLYRHIIEMTDGAEVLISKACATPAIPLVRSSFEALLSIEYILEDRENYLQRSLSWLVGYAHQRLDFYERLDPSTGKGKEFTARAENDFIMQRFKVPDLIDVPSAITILKSFLAKEHIQPIQEAWVSQRLRNWYQLFDGPPNLYELSDYLRRGGQYDHLYRHWSRVSHAHDLPGFLARDADGDATIGPLRQSNELQDLASFAASHMLGATIKVVNKARPDEDLSIWYKREIMENYCYLTGIKSDHDLQFFSR